MAGRDQGQRGESRPETIGDDRAAGSEAYFVPVGPDTYLPTEHAGGAWSDDELHISPVGALLVEHLERWRAQHADPDKVLGRISIDILGQLRRGPIQLSTRMLRPGRTIELLETTAVIAGRETLRARSWVMSAQVTAEVAGTELPPLPGPEGLPERSMAEDWTGGFIHSISLRDAEPKRPGRGRRWLRAVREKPREWMFPNLDLTIHLMRRPTGRWLGLDTTVSFGPTGQGLTSSVLHDQEGPLGSVQQTLTVRPIPRQA